jgi:hypothetical protein
MDALSELEEVRRKIGTAEARLARAEADGLPIDNPGVVALRNELIRLYDEKSSLRSSASSQFFGFILKFATLTMKQYLPVVFFIIIFLPSILISDKMFYREVGSRSS